MDNAPVVEILEGEDTLGEVEHGVTLLQEPVHGEQGLEVTPDHVLHHQEHVVHCLEAVEEPHHERGLGDGQCISLSDDLHRENHKHDVLRVITLPDPPYFSEPSHSSS